MTKKPPKVTKPENLTIDYRQQNMPVWVKDVIETQLAIEAEDVKSAGQLGFMARALVIATMPYKDPKTDAFTRQNGDFRLRILAGYEGGIPYGIYPRLLMSWVATEAVRKQSPVIELGDSLRSFMRDVLELRSTGGGVRGSGARVTEQMKRLFGSLITAQYTGGSEHRGFTLKNVLITDEVYLDHDEMDNFIKGIDQPSTDSNDTDGQILWTPQAKHEAGQWRSQVKLSDNFFQECINKPVPIDLRAYKSLRGSPLAMDIYTWLTYRMSYTTQKTRPIRWESLMMQFGSGFNTSDLEQAVRNFKKQFLKALKLVHVVYPKANLEIHENGLVLMPSPSHVPPKLKQPDLF